MNAFGIQNRHHAGNAVSAIRALTAHAGADCRITRITATPTQMIRMINEAADTAAKDESQMDFFASMAAGMLASKDAQVFAIGAASVISFGTKSEPNTAFYDATLAALNIPVTIAQLAEHDEDFVGAEDGGHHLWWALMWDAMRAKERVIGDLIGAPPITDPLYLQHLSIARRMVAAARV